MAAKKPTGKTVDVDGIEVVIDTEYINSWDGVIYASKMNKIFTEAKESGKELDEAEVINVVLPYYQNAIANIDSIKEQLGGGNVPFADVFAVLSNALSIGSAKN